MNDKNSGTLSTQSILEGITHTLLYEGYSLYPYNRSAVKNQKPVPFGVIFPRHNNAHNEHARSKMQTQCIVKGSDDFLINITVRFLHLKKTELFERITQEQSAGDFSPVHSLHAAGKFYQAGWQTIERKITSGDLQIPDVLKNKKFINVEFDKMQECEWIYDESTTAIAKQINGLSLIRGLIIIEADPLDVPDAFRLTVTVMNTTPVENAERLTADEIFPQSFLSTHIILQTTGGAFISHQNPGEKWEAAIAACENINTWPILIDESNSTMLSSPIILYDYPQIHPQSAGDLFDSTEIEEALLLHVALLPDEEKQRIAQSDEKLQAMLEKVSRVTPKELMGFHSGLKDETQNHHNAKKSDV